MKSYDLIKMCFGNLARRKVRTLLTTIGVIVGTCSIIVMISFGIGMKQKQDEMLAQMGDLTIIEVSNFQASADKAIIDDALLESIKKMTEVEGVTPIFRPNGFMVNLYAGSKDRYLMNAYNIIGVYPDVLEKFGFKLKSGRFIKNDDKQFSLVFGENASYDFCDTKKVPPNDRVFPEKNPQTGKMPIPFIDPMKEKIILKTQSQMFDEKGRPIDDGNNINKNVSVVGVMKADNSKGYESFNGVYMSVTDLKSLIKEYNRANKIKSTKDKGYEVVRVKVKDIKNVEKIEKIFKDMGFQTFSMESIRKPMQKQAMQQQIILGCLGGISLLVAAIGITNTMIMSIYERTREIGIMKVLGCYVKDIKSIFLIESGLIGFMGGIFGIGISYLISYAINHIGKSTAEQPGMGMGIDPGAGVSMGYSVIPIWLVLGALVFSTLIGLIAGFYPANRAVKISAIEAIRTT